MADDLKILCVAPAYPWPQVDGYRLRLANMVLALADAGSVDLVTFRFPGAPDPDPLPDARIRHLPFEADPQLGRAEWLGPWLRSGLPRQALMGKYRTAAAAGPTVLGAGPYDVVYVSNLDTWIELRQVLPAGPVIIDFDNLQHLLLRARWRRGPVVAGDASLGRRAASAGRWAAASVFDVVDERRWARWQQEAARQVAAVTVCSELDVRRSGCVNAVAIPNGYELAWTPRADRARVPSDPVLLFTGLLSYEPNADAVRWFAGEVLPRLRRQVPRARFRVVGRGSDTVADVARLPGVELVGEVRSMQRELERADLSVVPIRFGAGTRLKVTEALANHLPCVTTTVGAEGIDVVDGRHVLVADDAESFARSCGKLLGDAALRRRLTGAGAELYRTRYQWPVIRARLTRLARAVAAGSDPVADDRR